MACECIKKIDADLKPKGRRLVTAFTIGQADPMEAVIVETEKVSGTRQKPFRVAATFCPFCGTKYRAERVEEAA